MGASGWRAHKKRGWDENNKIKARRRVKGRLLDCSSLLGEVKV